MPDIVITASAAHIARAVDAICGLYSYQALLPGGGANPETRNQFAKRQLGLIVRQKVIEWESGEAARAATAAAITSAEQVVIT